MLHLKRSRVRLACSVLVALTAMASSASAQQKSAPVSLHISDYVRVATDSSGQIAANGVGITASVSSSGGVLSVSDAPVTSVYVWSNTAYRITAGLEDGVIRGGNSRSIGCECFFTDEDAPGMSFSSPHSSSMYAIAKVYGVKLVPYGDLEGTESDAGTYIGSLTVEISVSS